MKKKTIQKGFSVKELDASIHPADDLFLHVNGKWRKKTNIPADKSRWGSFDILREESVGALKEILEEIAAKRADSVSKEERKLHDLYLSGINEKKRNARGYKDLLPYMEKISRVTKETLPSCVAELIKIGVSPFFSLHVDYDDKNSAKHVIRIRQGGLSLPDRDYYLEKNARFTHIREKYLRYMENVFMLAGEHKKNATKNARLILDMETRWAREHLPREKTRDPKKNYHKMSVSALAKKCAPFAWRTFIACLRKETMRDVVVDQLAYAKFISKEITALPLAHVRIYLTWHLLDSYAGALGTAFCAASFDFHGRTIVGTKKPRPLWKQAVGVVDGYMGEAIGKLYVKKHFPREARAQMETLVRNVKKVFAERIRALTWMDKGTKVHALKKLSTLVTKIGHPRTWRSYAKLSLTDSYAENIIRLNVFHFEEEIRKVGKRPNRAEWHMSPATVNAYYSPNFNEIVFPAAILQPPFFDPKRDSAFNYGGIGSVIGHEISHAFDDSGAEFDHKGNMKNWWSERSKKQFGARTKMLVRQYNAYEPLPGQKLNGKLTLGENIADLCGVLVGYYAYQKYLRGGKRKDEHGLTPEQRYFIGYALTEREKARPELRAMYIKTDPHSPSEFRVNGVIKNMREFFDAFNATEKHDLYLPSHKRAHIW